MPLPVVAFFPWLIGLLASVTTSAFTWFVSRMVFEKAVQYALITAFLVAAAALTVTVSLSIKAAIFAARVAMPNSLGMATYFLPGNINTVFAIIFTMRVSMALYRWTVATMSYYLPSKTGAGLLRF